MSNRVIHERLSEEHRKKIQTSAIVNRLNSIAVGDVDVTPTQMRAIEVALRKTVPDLTSITIKGDETNPLNAVVRFGWAPTKP